jgi:predicted deacylase
MQKSVERIAGDSEGVSYEFPVFRFGGIDKAEPSAYLQAALHAGELPGVVAIDALMPMLEKAEAEGRIKGNITIVPQANPIGRAQYHFGEHQGPFSPGHAHQLQPRLSAAGRAGHDAVAGHHAWHGRSPA